jgi:succinyl-diaminopimelate desuccinylase
MGFSPEWTIAAAQKLVKIPSRGGVDDAWPICETAQKLAEELGLTAEIIREDDIPVGVWIKSPCANKARRLFLVACIDTSGYEADSWRIAPTNPVIENGWMNGRGSADSKTMAALFMQVAKTVAEEGKGIDVFLDANEHTGEFLGVRALKRVCPDIEGGYIGYPGIDYINRGARGFWRVRIICEGKEGHTGEPPRPNALNLAGRIIAEIEKEDFKSVGEWENWRPQWTVIGLKSGGDWGRIPQKAELLLDVRLTEKFTKSQAQAKLKGLFERMECRQQVIVEDIMGAPAYALPAWDPVVETLQRHAKQLGLNDVENRVCGPSNVGNFFAQLGASFTCGWGPRYKNLHAPNEAVCVEDLPTVFEVYHRAVRELV